MDKRTHILNQSVFFKYLRIKNDCCPVTDLMLRRLYGGGDAERIRGMHGVRLCKFVLRLGAFVNVRAQSEMSLPAADHMGAMGPMANERWTTFQRV
jgi:hypothetical protein